MNGISIMKSNQSDASEQEHKRLHRSVLSSVSHDLKTPLSCIIGSLEIYGRTKKKLSPDKQDMLIRTALQEAYRLDGFITNILDMAKLESRAVKLKKERCAMNILLEDCLILFGHRLAECDVRITAIPATFPVTTDPALLMRALCILLDNAAKYGKPHPVVDVEYKRIAKQVVICVQDNGPGIPESKLEDIFSKYTRFATQDRTRPGTGLGLPICREIMRLLGGTVTAGNRADGKGAVFTLAFPV